MSTSDLRRLMSELTRLAQSVALAPDETTRLQVTVDSAVSLVDRCHHAGVTINDKGGLLTRVSSDDVVRRANELQLELGEGPCLDVMREQDTLVCPDLVQEPRWPLWAKRVHTELGVGSMMSLLVHTGRCSYGVLSLYADHRRAFDGDAVAVGQALASHLAVMIGTGRQIGQLEIAMQSRTIIGQAQGILMRDLNMSADRAFDYLRRLSSESNRKLSVIAMEIAHTRQVPLPPRSGRLAAS